jgi:hypothetical protein
MAWIGTKWVVLGDAAPMWFPVPLGPLSFTSCKLVKIPALSASMVEWCVRA